jgi:hypothetical protein
VVKTLNREIADKGRHPFVISDFFM